MAGRKEIPSEEKKVSAGVWVKKKNLKKIKPILLRIIKRLDR